MKPQSKDVACNVSLCTPKEITLKYKGKDVGKHRIDFMIEDKVL